MNILAKIGKGHNPVLLRIIAFESPVAQWYREGSLYPAKDLWLEILCHFVLLSLE